MKRKMKKKLIAFMLCMVLVICNSVSILADAPAAATTTAENQVSETKTVKNETTSGEDKSSDDNSADKDKDTSSQSDDPKKEESDKAEAPETKTTEQKEETTEATTEAKEDTTTATTEAEEGTSEAEESSDKEETTGAADDSDKKEEASETSEETTETMEEASTETSSIAEMELTYEDDDVTVTVTANDENAIPEGVSLKVVPVLENNEDTQEQYTEVKEQLEAKVAENNEDIAGFFAYDITFIDEEGNEIEPLGEVKISLTYKNSVLPDGLSEKEAPDMDVTVMHLEENENGDVKEVVNMSESNQVENVQATDLQAVEKAEFVTNSFSVFTITWIDDKAKSLTVYCVDAYGNNINVGNNGNLDETTDNQTVIRNISVAKEVNVAQLSTMIDDIDSDTYVYEGAYITGGNITSKRYIRTIKYTEGVGWQYRYENNWKNIGNNQNVYFQYGDGSPTDVDKVSTVDSVAEGIDINLFNYNNGINQGAAYNAGFYFYGSDTELDNGHSGGNLKYTHPSPDGGQGIYQNYVKNNLNDGFPELMDGEATLGYLFGTGSSGVTGAYRGLNGLFQKNSEGYYYYNSANNHAQLNTQQWRLDLYNATLSPNKNETSNGRPVDGFTVGNFLPFNQLPGNAQEGELSSVAGGRTMTDLWFGMNINATFYQPKDGKVNGQEMTFSFTGDDDVWVFIDGVKVLDLGGIHYLQSGTINFSTGDVIIEGKINAGNSITTIAEAFEAAYRESHTNPSNAEVNSYLNGIFNKGSNGNYTSFKNFSSHEMKFFYLERGAGASNCEIQFNMPVMPKDSITIGKEISNYEQGAYSDVEFEFELYTGETGEEKDAFDQVTTGTYTLIKADGTRVPNQSFTDDGKIILKHGEQALFSDQFDQGTKYYVKETGLSSNTYDKVIIESSGVVNEDDDSIIDSDQTEIESTILTVGENYFVNFQNRCAATNMKHLIIEKKMQEGSTSNEYFKVKVTLAGEVYTGGYKIGSSYTDALAQTEKTTDNGEISLKAGQVVVILGYAYTVENQGQDSEQKKGIPSGTSFKVEEIGLDSTVYANPSYTASGADEINTEDSVTGKINIDANAKVTVTNKYTAEEDTRPYITVSKTFSGLSWNQIRELMEPDEFELTVSEKENPQNSFTLKLTDENVTIEPDVTQNSAAWNTVQGYTFTWRLDNCDTGTYVVAEKNENLDGYINSSSGLGEEISVSESTWEFSSNPTTITENNNVSIKIGSQSIIAASLTSQDGYFVWTSETLSSAQKLAVVNWMNSDAVSSNFTTGKVSINECNFYSGNDLITGIQVGSKGYIQFTPGSGEEEEGILNFLGGPSQWQHVLRGDYSWSGRTNGDIEVTNNYTEEKTSIDIIKYGTKYDNVRDGAVFSLYKGDKEGNTIQWYETPVEDYGTINVQSTGASELNLSTGYYKLIETKAPTGYQLLDEEIYFWVDGGIVKLITQDGDMISSNATEMWKLDTDNNTFVLKIKNDVLYNLPSAGGPGVHWYTLGGTLLMAGAALIVYRQKRKREVLLKK